MDFVLGVPSLISIFSTNLVILLCINDAVRSFTVIGHSGRSPLSRLFPARYPTIVVNFVHAFISMRRRLGKLKVSTSRRDTIYCISSSFFSFSTCSFVLSNSMQLYLSLMRGSCHLTCTSTVLHTYMYVTHRNTKSTICPLISIFCFLQSLTGSN
jgi:hypothetical protein